MKSPVTTLCSFACAFGLMFALSSCVTPSGGMEGDGRSSTMYDAYDVKQIFLMAYQQGNKRAARAVASPEAIAKVPWNGDPEAFLQGDSIMSGEGGFEIVMMILSDGHVGANIADVTVRH